MTFMAGAGGPILLGTIRFLYGDGKGRSSLFATATAYHGGRVDCTVSSSTDVGSKKGSIPLA